MIIYNYITTNLLNNKKYVGMHSTNNVDDGYLGSGRLVLKAIKKYGKENFIREVLCFCKTPEEAFKNEAIFIKEYKTLVSENGYNLSPTGGVGSSGGRHSEESIKATANANRGRKASKETIKRLKDSHKGQVAWNKGLTKKNNRSIKIMAENMSGENHYMYGRTGEDNPLYGRRGEGTSNYGKRGKEMGMYGITGAKNTKSKPVIQFTLGLNFIKEWECGSEVERVLGINRSNINKCTRGERNFAGGFIWKFKETK